MKTLVRKYLSGKSTETDKEKLLDWMRAGKNLKDFGDIKKEWEREAIHNEIPEESKEVWLKLQRTLLKDTQFKLQRSTRYLKIFQYAAIFIAFVFVAGLSAKMIGYDFGKGVQFTTVKADLGQMANVVLPDETEVWLNSGSYIKYNDEFAATNREIELVGEAYFSVTKNPKLPLVVTGSSVHVKVLGTKFNVSAYPEDSYFNVTLEEGKVELNSDQYKDFYKTLSPGELAIFNKNTAKLSVQKVNVDLYTSWKDGMINIYNLPLSEVVIKLEKRYNQKFEIAEDIKDLRFTYTITNEPLSEVLHLMETITPIKVVQKGDIISLKQNHAMN